MAKASFLTKFLLFDGIATGVPCIALGVWGYKVAPFIGVSGRYATVKFSALAAYGCTLALTVMGQPQASRSSVIFAAVANVVFAGETLHAYSTGKLVNLTRLGKQMMGSLAAGGLVFPLVLWRGWVLQQATA